MQHPVIVIEDSHENTVQLLAVIDRLMQPGDYLVVEDTLDVRKHRALEQFLMNSDYLVDTHYCDFWGFNNSWNFNSFLLKA